MIVGIADQMPKKWADEFVQACRRLGLSYRRVAIGSHDWLHEVDGVDCLVWRVSIAEPSIVMEARAKIPLIESLGITCFPSSQMLWLYDDKVRQALFAQRYHIPMPATHISFDRADAETYLCREAAFPLVRKTSSGASSDGVTLLRNLRQAKCAMRKEFNERSLGSRLLRAVLKPAQQRQMVCAARRLAALRRERYFLVQEFIPTDGDWRVTTFGRGIVSVFKRMNRQGDFRASGSGQWEMCDDSTAPLEPCRLAMDISAAHGFTSMAYDFLQSDHGWLIGEMSYTFLLHRVYTETLFQYCDASFRKIDPAPIGELHLRALLAQRQTGAVHPVE